MYLPTRRLGKNGPEITALGLGLMGLSVGYGKPRSDPERLAFLTHAYKLGETSWDTADVYGDNEDVLGKWFAANPEKRSDVFLATKFGLKYTAEGLVIDSSPQYVKQALESSLKRLGVPSVDLYYCHRLDGRTPIEKTVQALTELKRDGKINYIGLSECSTETLRRACKVTHIDAVQIEYSPFALDAEKVGLFQACIELGVAFVAYAPLGRGMLSGAYKSRDDFDEDDYRRHTPRFSEENFPKNLVLVEKITDLAKAKGVTPSQLTLAWLMAQGDYVIPIPGTTKEVRLEENLGALKIKITPEEMKLIRSTTEAAEIHGDRYPKDAMGSLFANTPPL
ncbi:aldo/keto reductase-like protein [Dothidotthia symphoricarpi CBS 119687]|uniref:Aldo/keto reductase-like protein n=1 Tax=Dothidotthia symphoricarpi CBS 119687 TaxID=1392245 RepID=A0A6A6AHG7_9PLEO|nr:aldo/keto reductase-like protein [Dothidotthia symphoricarpi CBS 119687]KAF2130693.1 aldo/keto reductase-like protein [Dothidotthia symphoricarpi CBS 119687]